MNSYEASNVLPEGWSIIENGISADGLYQPSSGSNPTPDLYNFGSNDSSDRALGGILGPDLDPLFGVSFSNQTGKTIERLEVNYTGEQWRSGKIGRKDKIVFELSLDATSLNSGTWVEYETLTFFTPDTQKVGAKDGNNPTYRLELQGLIDDLYSINGQTFWIRWRDHDARDNDDGLAVDDFSLTAFTMEENPQIIGFTPLENESNVDLSSNLNFTFSEPVNLQPGWLEMNCSISGLHAYSITGSETTFIIHPDIPFEHGETCQVKVVANLVQDIDSDDPPDGLAANLIYSFTTLPAPDEAPFIVSISPANNEKEVKPDQGILLSFSEPVNFESGWMQLHCGFSGARAVTISGGPQDYILTPFENFSYGETCELTIFAAHVKDMDQNDPPDTLLMDQSIFFSIQSPPDEPPSILSVTPASSESGVSITGNLTFRFSEAVQLDENWLDLSCASSGNHAVTISLEGGVVTAIPQVVFDYDETCVINILAEKVHDSDEKDPPDQMTADFQSTFTTASAADLAPWVVKTSPEDHSSGVQTVGYHPITFSEAVFLHNNWINFSCSKSGNHGVSLEGGPVVYSYATQDELAYAEVCTITLFASQITDLDSIDPPDGMESDYVFSFTTQVDPDSLTFPVVEFGTNTYPSDGEVLESGITQFTLQFSKDLIHDGSDDAVNNPLNYRLFSIGKNRVFDTTGCGSVLTDDIEIPVNLIEFNAENYLATLFINNGTNLPNDIYRLIVCGESTIRDEEGNALNDGYNTYITFTVNASGHGPVDPPSGGQPLEISATPTPFPLLIPVTGFPLNHVTPIIVKPGVNNAADGMWLEIPDLEVIAPVTGIPLENGLWEVSWLADQAGWLEGSAFPSSSGNSVLTGHVWNANNTPGIFHRLNDLVFGDQILIHAFGKTYLYEVRERLTTRPDKVGEMLTHYETPWLTLVTCQDFDEESSVYKKRTLVRAELVEIKEEN
jgi:LPXTG-site transpeptidase (sortase) family protein